jgi:hypothetical protein
VLDLHKPIHIPIIILAQLVRVLVLIVVCCFNLVDHLFFIVVVLHYGAVQCHVCVDIVAIENFE